MLSGSDPGDVDLVKEKKRLSSQVPSDLASYITKEMQQVILSYTVLHYPEKIKSLNFDNGPVVSGILDGIKGQYLMLDQNRVINMRKYGVYLIRLQTGA